MVRVPKRGGRYSKIIRWDRRLKVEDQDRKIGADVNYGEGDQKTEVPYEIYRLLHKSIYIDRIVEMARMGVNPGELGKGRIIISIETGTLKEIVLSEGKPAKNRQVTYKKENGEDITVPYWAYQGLNEPDSALFVTSVTPRHKKIGPRK